MIEALEGISEAIRDSGKIVDMISASQAEYINECVEGGYSDNLIDRIDELNSYVPPKAIDSNNEIAEWVSPVKDLIESKYLEAPADMEQVNNIGDYLTDVEDLQYENWQQLSTSNRRQVLIEAECRIAELEHRSPCEINFSELPPGHLGFYSSHDKSITLNTRYIEANDFESYKETLDTLIHEGRHAYQDYNMTEREVHPRTGEVTNWRWNQYDVGYKNAELYGYEIYAMQPVEADARAFAEDVLNEYFNKNAQWKEL